MTRAKTIFNTICLLGLALALAQPAFAATQSVIYVGGWSSTGSGNPTGSGGPGVAVGQKFVIRIAYDDTSTTTDNVPVLTSGFTDSGNDMRTIKLDGPGNSLDIFVPMEGLDSGSPFIYIQDETDHFPAFITNPTLNFTNLSSISNPANIIGLEFEGDFAGGGFNVIELFNTSPPAPPPPAPLPAINMVSQILNCGDINCLSSAIASRNINALGMAVALIIDAGPNIVYDAANLTKTTSSSITQSNDLGALRSDNEDFIDPVWSKTGTPAGTNLNDIAVGIVNSGLTMTTSTTTSWNVTMTEQMTGVANSDSIALVSYSNVTPSGSASATPTGPGTDFTLTFGDADLAVNALIGGFEMLTVTALVDGTMDGTAFFATLISTGTQSSTNAALEAAFGTGMHTVVFTIADKAGASVTPSADFEVLIAVCGNSNVEPGEECDGGACCTGTCEFASAAVVCNTGSGDLCDPDELCTGSSAACPNDNIAPPTTSCRPGSGDLCDPDESCTGNPGQACPNDNIAPPTTSCRPGSGDLCDPDESCTGNPGEACPNDNIAPPTTSCRPGSGDLCDPDESCTGNPGEACPDDNIAPPTTSCRPGSGDL
jgi:hypothetical protein